MKRTAFLIASVLAASAHAAAGSCTMDSCPAGTEATTYAKKAEPFYACPTQELAEYTALILGLVAAQATLVGGLPNISDKTGEPIYEDGSKTNQTNQMVAYFRERAAVQTFDGAIQRCTAGQHKRQIMVMNSPSNSTSSYVMDVKAKRAYWMPRSHIDAKKPR